MAVNTGIVTAFTNLFGKVLSTQWFQGKWTISQDYGPTAFTHEPAYGPYLHFHNGLDLAGSGIAGTPVLAGVEAQITEIGFDPNGYGNFIKLTPTNAPDITILLGHLKDTLGNQNVPLLKGDALHVGDTTGHVGSTGNSTGAHLHFSVFQNGAPVNPVPYLTGTASGQANAPLAHDTTAQKNAAAPQNLPGPNLNKLLDFITSSTNWWRILIVGTGVVLIFIGVTGYFAPRAAKVAPVPL
jgi:Peptidase family M23